MSTFILLANLTEQGVSKLKEFGARARAFRELAAQYGVTVKDLYWTRGGYEGGYDIVTVLEAPDERCVTGLTVAVDTRGNVRTLMLRAFPVEVMEEIIARIPQPGAPRRTGRPGREPPRPA